MGNTGKILGMGLLVALCLQVFFLSSIFAIPPPRKFTWVLQETNVTKMCDTHEVVTVNGQYPGPTATVRDGDYVSVTVINKSKYNATIHWHGVFQLRTAWADGPEYITQCPIQPGGKYTHKFRVTGQHGTLWWHAHFSWLRATAFGAFIILPPRNYVYPFEKPKHEETLLLNEWWDANPMDVIAEALRTGTGVEDPATLVINGQPGELVRCSDTTRIKVKKGEKVYLRIINAAMNTAMFAAVANHTLTVVAADANYVQPFNTSYIVIDPGQTLDAVLTADQPCGTYYFAPRMWANTGTVLTSVATRATAIIEYSCPPVNSTTPYPNLPDMTDNDAVESFHRQLHGLESKDVPTKLDEDMLIAVSLNQFICPNQTCDFATSLNNVSFKFPTVSILNAYYHNIPDVYTPDFPDRPIPKFNFTDTSMPDNTSFTIQGTRVKMLRYNSAVQIVLQGTGFQGGESHPLHLHGQDFYVVGRGFGNFDHVTDTAKFNLTHPISRNTVSIPINGWTAIRFVAKNPGAWLMHCHLDHHLSVGMGTVFITEDGDRHDQKLLPPPPDLPKC